MKSILFATLLVGCWVLYCAGAPPAVKYVVVIDAGSTGNRAAGYKYSISSKGLLKLEREEMTKNKGGLTTLPDVAEGAAKIAELLTEIKGKLELTDELAAQTPVILRGTGGLRKVSKEEADRILAPVREVIKSSGFLAHGNFAQVLSGTHEAVFSWFSVNYLLGRWGKKNTVAALDLGGASTQITTAIVKKNDVSLNNHVFTVSTPFPKSQAEVFSTSYMNLGAESVRQAVFTYDNPDGATELKTICMHQDTVPSTIGFGKKTYQVRGIPNDKGQVDFDACTQLVRDQTLNLVQPRPSPLKDVKDIYAFSGFFFRFSKPQVGLIDGKKGGKASVEDILTSAKKVCSVKQDGAPFLCLDLIYMHVLLSEGYGLKPSTNINFQQTLDGHDVSFTLGVGYDELSGLKVAEKPVGNDGASGSGKKPSGSGKKPKH
ncbi:ectonucleoside triphosphate diphosphohydrolase 5-like [Contarinia nasturtii]|uniref:ectonucleoside triphosphate diphosphohydrolase 5-like n=1 Tax=Contarinia nasturtii TaxID=265458 RepID=UPI0012D38D9F|nr:ectonucleoside triphosphate diphosphohydrolase 5-like [Contarinia nasturtii]